MESPLEPRQKMARAHDGTRDQAREERDKNCVVQQRARRCGVAAVNVDHIAERFEDIERDSDGECDAPRRRGPSSEKIYGGGGEMGVFENE